MSGVDYELTSSGKSGKLVFIVYLYVITGYASQCTHIHTPHTHTPVFTARRLAKRGICRRRVSVCLAVCVCVCVCVCPSHSGIVSKRLNVGSRK